MGQLKLFIVSLTGCGTPVEVVQAWLSFKPQAAIEIVMSATVTNRIDVSFLTQSGKASPPHRVFRVVTAIALGGRPGSITTEGACDTGGGGGVKSTCSFVGWFIFTLAV